ncbi:spore germination protein [Bacillus sp. 165]|uniref:spore germination protein n=1 Tax=Bacillus sp. 165 TaxID=1529117 RepID=UPI0032AFDCE0
MLIREGLEEHTNNIKKAFHQTSDLVIKKINIGKTIQKEVHILYLRDIVDTMKIEETVIKPLLNLKDELKEKDLVEYLMEDVLESSEVEKAENEERMVEGITQGNAVLLCEQSREGIIVSTSKWAERSLEEAISERSSRGPVIGLTEKLATNLNLIRSALRTSDLFIETTEYGTFTKTQVAVLHVEGIVDEGILKVVKKRLKNINVKYLATSKIIENALEGESRIFFSLARQTDRIDGVVSALMEGRIVVIIEGIPYAIIAPALFVDFIQGADEYHQNFGRVSNRTVRLVGFLLGIYLPGVFLALEKFHQKDIPKKIADTLFSKEELLPTFWGIFILLLLLRALLDISFHLPKSSIILVSLLGTILIGETSVTAKLIHPVVLIVTTLTEVSNFLTLNRGLGTAQRVLQLTFLLTASFFGFTGLIIGNTILIMYMVSLRSIGVPFLSPIIPFKLQEMKDVLYRGDLQKLINSKHQYLEDRE